ncbi:type 1 glutamine amidotransferase domain-containing protein [Streptomyces sp. NPDC101393]|uniref:type 1 glutamine amidotransferase domain-containing protein n=1 Tax=Streptomyces sp. NPDC101393 TaxID=3366141 RepID=UPI0037F2F155
MRVLIPLPDRDFDITEVAVPWRLLTDAGHRVTFTTERAGTRPAGDPKLLTGALFGRLGAATEPKRCYDALRRSTEFAATVSWAELVPDAFDGRILPGGHAPGMRRYLGSQVLRRQVGRF